jgi:hypothetical protein
MVGASDRIRTDGQRFTKSRRHFERIGRFLASQFRPEFTWLGYQPPGQFRGYFIGKWPEIQKKYRLARSVRATMADIALPLIKPM